MSIEVIRYLAVNLGASIAASARPAATLLVVQLVVVVLVDQGLAVVPESYDWLISAPAVIVVAAFAVVEMLAKHDTDIAAITRELKIDNLTGVFGAAGAVFLFASLGLPESEAEALIEGGTNAVDDAAVLQATAEATTTDHGAVVQGGVVLVAIAVNLVVTRLREEVLQFAHDFAIGQLWARVETGGVVGLLILLPFFPLVALVFFLVFALGLAATAIAIRTARKAADERRRTPCEECDYSVRVEASVCPECDVRREPESVAPASLKVVLESFAQDSQGSNNGP